MLRSAFWICAFGLAAWIGGETAINAADPRSANQTFHPSLDKPDRPAGRTDSVGSDMKPIPPAAAREVIRDNRFQRGLILWKPEPGRHVRYGELPGREGIAGPVWGLSQWSSKFPLDPSALTTNSGTLICSNAAKSVALGISGSADADISLAVNTGVEYGAKARARGEPWVHLLVEQTFKDPPPLDQLSAAILHLEARLLRARDLHRQDYSPDIHAAQFQLFFTVQNRNRQSPGYGDFLWFGVPIYDNRARFPKAHMAQDFGGTAKFIFTPGGRTFSTVSAHDGEWITVEKDLLPLMREALETAWARGFLGGSKAIGDYRISGMNMGWEVPGTFHVAMQVRRLSLRIVRRRRPCAAANRAQRSRMSRERTGQPLGAGEKSLATPAPSHLGSPSNLTHEHRRSILDRVRRMQHLGHLRLLP